MYSNDYDGTWNCWQYICICAAPFFFRFNASRVSSINNEWDPLLSLRLLTTCALNRLLERHVSLCLILPGGLILGLYSTPVVGGRRGEMSTHDTFIVFVLVGVQSRELWFCYTLWKMRVPLPPLFCLWPLAGHPAEFLASCRTPHMLYDLQPGLDNEPIYWYGITRTTWTTHFRWYLFVS